jgi:immune inhibitor A
MKTIVLTAIFLILMSNMILACPANPNATHNININGQEMLVREWGDEFAHGYETLDGYTIIKNNGLWYYAASSDEGKLKPTSIIVNRDNPVISKIEKHIRPSLDFIMNQRELILGKKEVNFKLPDTRFEGDWNVIAILIDFPDHPHTFSREDYQQLLFSGNPENPRSMTDYYKEVSYGKFRIAGEVVGWFTAKHNREYYKLDRDGNGDYTHVQERLFEAANAADPYVDYTRFDNDKDGDVDAVNIFYEGSRFDDDGIWPHLSWNRSDSEDGVQFLDFTILDGTQDNGITTIGAFCHEYGHSLDLPDLYDYGNTSKGIGAFGTMGTGNQNSAFGKAGDSPAHLCAWCKKRLGWIDPKAITSSFNCELLPVETTPECCSLRGNLPDKEYFLIENRQKIGFDRALPGDNGGILIWHINENFGSNVGPFMRAVDLEQAQEVQTLDLPNTDPRSSMGDDNDYFRAGKEFTNYTNPNSKSATDNKESAISVGDFQIIENSTSYRLYTAIDTIYENKIESWEFDTGDHVKGTPVIGQDRTIYVGSDNGYLYAVNNDGTLKWRQYTGKSDDTYYAIGPNDIIYTSMSDFCLYAIYPSGLTIWKCQLLDAISNCIAISHNGTAYIGSNTSLYSISPEGSINWSVNIGAPVSNIAIGNDSTIYVLLEGSPDLRAINSNGEEKWRITLDYEYAYLSKNISSEGTLYLSSKKKNSNEGSIIAINPDGSTKWTFNVSFYFRSEPNIGANGTIYAISSNAVLFAINIDGTQKWTFLKTGTHLHLSPVIGPSGNIYASSSEGYVSIISPDGVLVKSYGHGETKFYMPAVDQDGNVYVGSYKGSLYAFKEFKQGPYDMHLLLHLEPAKLAAYASGDKLNLILDLYTKSQPVVVDIYFALLNNTSGKIFFGMGWEQLASPLLQNFTIPQDQAYYNVSIMTLTLPVKIPPITVPGQYTFAIAATEADTYNLISNIGTASFFVK